MAVQFNPVRIKNGPKPDKENVGRLMTWGKIFDTLGMVPYVNKKGSAGNMGFRSARGICVTSSGSFMGDLKPDNIMTIVDVREGKKGPTVYFYGHSKKLPTSEALIYWDIFKLRPDVNVVLHGHDCICLEKN